MGWLRILSEWVGPSGHVVGADIDVLGAWEQSDGLGVTVETRLVDLEQPWTDLGVFDAVLVFNYLDRSRMNDVRAAVAPGGILLLETFLESQRAQGWGPESPEHLLRAGELRELVAPLTVLHGREVLEPVEGNRWRAIASIVARNIR